MVRSIRYKCSEIMITQYAFELREIFGRNKNNLLSWKLLGVARGAFGLSRRGRTMFVINN